MKRAIDKQGYSRIINDFRKSDEPMNNFIDRRFEMLKPCLTESQIMTVLDGLSYKSSVIDINDIKEAIRKELS